MLKRAKILAALQRGLDLTAVLKRPGSLFEGREGVKQVTPKGTAINKNDFFGGKEEKGGNNDNGKGGKGVEKDKGGGGDEGRVKVKDEDFKDVKRSVVEALTGGVTEEQHVKDHRHHDKYGGATLAAFIKRRRKEKRLIERFESMEEWVRERDPSLADDLSHLREEHLVYKMTWCRLRYHPRLLKTKDGEEEEEEEEEVEEVVILEEEEEEEESQEDIERLLDPDSDLTLGPFTRPPKYPPRINILWRVRLSAAEREKRERRRRLQEAREALSKKLSRASLHTGASKGGFGVSRAGSYVSLATRQYRQRQTGLSAITPLEAPLPEGGILGPLPAAPRSFLPLRKNSSSSFLAPPPYSALERSGKIHVKEFKPSLASKLFERKTVTKVEPFKFHDFGSKNNHWCTMPHH